MANLSAGPILVGDNSVATINDALRRIVDRLDELSGLRGRVLINDRVRVSAATQDEDALNKGEADSTFVSLSGTQTITGPKTFDRDPSAPFAVSASSAVVTNLDADMVDGLHAASFVQVTGIQTAAGAKTWSDKAVFSGEAEIDGALNHDGTTVGFYGVTPVVRAAAYTPTNVTADRAYNANATTVDELADVLGTLIADLQALGLVQ